MPVRVVIELDHDGIRALLNEPGVAAACREQAERIAAAAGDGFHVTREYHPSGARSMFRVYGDSDEARFAEADEKTLSKAVSSCRS